MTDLEAYQALVSAIAAITTDAATTAGTQDRFALWEGAYSEDMPHIDRTYTLEYLTDPAPSDRSSERMAIVEMQFKYMRSAGMTPRTLRDTQLIDTALLGIGTVEVDIQESDRLHFPKHVLLTRTLLIRYCT